MSEYVVDVKPSARRTNGAVGRAVNRRGGRRAFDSRAEADEWAADLSEEGERRVWIRDANPDDATGADGYLVGRRSARGRVVRVEGPGSDGRGSEGKGSAAAAAADQSALGVHGDGKGRRNEDRDDASRGR